MNDAVLSRGAAAMPALPSTATGDRNASSMGRSSDPFAALLAGAASGVCVGENFAAAPGAKPLLASAPPSGTPVPSLPAMATIVQVVPLRDASSDDTEIAAERDGAAENEKSTASSGDDALADAIATGPTAVLALAQAPNGVSTPNGIASLLLAAPPSACPIRAAVQASAPVPVAAAGRGDPAGSLNGAAFQRAVEPGPIAVDSPALIPAAPKPAAADGSHPDTSRTGEFVEQAPADWQKDRQAAPPPIAAAGAESDQARLPTSAALALGSIGTKIPTKLIETVTSPSGMISSPTSLPDMQQAKSAVTLQPTTQAEPVLNRTSARPRGEPTPVRTAAAGPRKRADPVAIEIAVAEVPRRAGGTQFSSKLDLVQGQTMKSDGVVEQTLSIARDGAWLDKLARDIAHSAGSGNDLQFKLEPQNLGSLTVAIKQSIDGASIRMTADTDKTRDILIDAQPRLIAEARVQGLRISETHVDLNDRQQSPSQDLSRGAQGNGGTNQGAQNGQNRQSSPAHQPFVSNLGRKPAGETESSADDSNALYA